MLSFPRLGWIGPAGAQSDSHVSVEFDVLIGRVDILGLDRPVRRRRAEDGRMREGRGLGGCAVFGVRVLPVSFSEERVGLVRVSMLGRG